MPAGALIATEAPVADERPYRFGPLEHHGLIWHWRGSQIAVLGGGVLTAFLLAVTTQQAAAAIAAGLAALAVAFVPVRGRTLEQWAPVVLRFAVRRATGRHRWTSAAPGLGHRLI